MRRRYIVTILTAFAVAAYLSMDESQNNKQIAQDIINAEPDYLITGLALSNYGKAGLLNQQIDSDKATHYPDNHSVIFVKPRIILRQGRTQQWGVTAKQGELIKDETLILKGDVQIVPLQQSPDAFSFSTDDLNINLTNQIADTDSQVIIESKQTKLTALGMNMNMNNQVTLFKSLVRGLHDPSIQ